MDTAYLYSKKALIGVIAIAFLMLPLSSCRRRSETPVFGGQSAVYEYNGWKFIVLTNASPSKDIQPWGFGNELILFKTMAALRLITL
jgi:hypothetical protein